MYLCEVGGEVWFSCLTHLTIKFILLIIVKMSTIVDILTFISRGELCLRGNHTVTEY